MRRCNRGTIRVLPPRITAGRRGHEKSRPALAKGWPAPGWRSWAVRIGPSRVCVADDAVEDRHEAGIVEVAAERGGVVEQRTAADRQRPEVGDPAAEFGGLVAGEGAVREGQRAVVDD